MVYIAFLRGINVGGKNKIKMSELKIEFEQLGLKNVKTYIQSGNIIFDSDFEKQVLGKLIEDMIKEAFNLSITILLRTSIELEQIIQNCPFTEGQLKNSIDSTDDETHYVALLPFSPVQDVLKRLEAYQTPQELFYSIGSEIHLLLHGSIRASRLAAQLQKSDINATIRNWRTINKILELTW